MTGKPLEGMSQRRFALELRAAIDFCWRQPSPALRQRVSDLVNAHPRAMRSQHVLHNLGDERLDWLRREGLL